MLAEGVEEAYKHLYDTYYSALVLFAAGYVKDLAPAEDLVQDVLCELWRQRAQLSEVVSLKAWLYVAVRNRCLNHLQRHKVEQKYLQRNPEQEAESFFLRVVEEEVYRLMKQAIADLPPKMKAVFDLVLERKTNAQMAQALGMSEEAVKAYRKRGMKILRLRLKHLGAWMYFFF